MMNADIYVVIGHRGTGKTTWVQNLKNTFFKDSCQLFDTDQEIERTTNKTISQLFEIGENHFRKIESEVFQSCIQKSQSFKGKVFIVLGAGYQGDIPKNCKVIHLARPSDSEGRVFFDRPRIVSHLNHFDEYQTLYKKRQTYYEKVRDVVWTRLDYFESLQEWDKVFFEKPLPFQNGVLTLNDSNLSLNHFDYFLHQKLKWNLKYIELKDSEVSEKFLHQVIQKIPLEKILFSFRDKKSEMFQNFLKQANTDSLTIDWPLEWGECSLTSLKRKHSLIYSLHDRDHFGSFQKTLEMFSNIKNSHLKLAIEINSFEELWQGHLWRMTDPKNRSFHPRSKDGRWKWYRVLFGSQQHLYFIKEDSASGVLDQPCITESVQYFQPQFKNFACVLGNPIEHSATPYEQQKFFNQYNMPAVKILMKEEQVHQSNLKILEDLGMKFAAVTSPLKKKFFALFKNSKYKTHCDISALNTLILTPKESWQGFNTDINGARGLLEFINSHGKETSVKKVGDDLVLNNSLQSSSDKNWHDKSIAVWGGGGTRDVLKSAFSKNPNISFYSGRTGELIQGSEQDPDIVIWAIGRKRMKDCFYPPWKPALVLDLNYTEDSPGREYALRIKAQYVSGWMWFKEQAKAQRELFKKLFTS